MDDLNRNLPYESNTLFNNEIDNPYFIELNLMVCGAVFGEGKR